MDMVGQEGVKNRILYLVYIVEMRRGKTQTHLGLRIVEVNRPISETWEPKATYPGSIRGPAGAGQLAGCQFYDSSFYSPTFHQGLLPSSMYCFDDGPWLDILFLYSYSMVPLVCAYKLI
eukprot:scaffold16666_cov83-Skeletonema_dohrnii-CCMP3373.AAC.2